MITLRTSGQIQTSILGVKKGDLILHVLSLGVEDCVDVNQSLLWTYITEFQGNFDKLESVFFFSLPFKHIKNILSVSF